MLAQAALDDRAVWSGVFYLAATILLIGIGVAVVVAIRSQLRRREQQSEQGLTLADIRRWQAYGMVSNEEGEQLKRAILESMKQSPGKLEEKKPDKLFQRGPHP